ncbi:MAG: TonB-dependent receptor [Thiotrichales bacterium]
MQRNPLSLAIGLSLFSISASAVQLEPLVVTSDLREVTDTEIAASVSVEDQELLQEQGATHFDDIILSLPNLNFSGQSSRPRHIQIRGIGERDEYTGAPNAAVGFAIDDIDFSGLGMAGNLFDVQQVEVLRGPQGTRYGANALGGLINIRTNPPSETAEDLLELSAGGDGFRELGWMTSGPLSKSEKGPLYRLAVFKHDSDGFRHNATLNRDDTNGRDELTTRGKLRFIPGKNTLIDLTLLHADLDNGYDAWSLDNSYTTLSDEPGDDIQNSDAAAVKIKYSGHPAFAFTSTTTASKTDAIYSYDGDWVYVGFHPDEYVYFYKNDKSRDGYSQELRFVSKPDGRLFNDSTDWLVGVYAQNFDENNQTTDNYGTNAITDYSATNLATFGQLDYHISGKTTFSAGARLENRSADFTNNNGEAYSPSDDMFGGHLTLTHAYNDRQRVYAGVTRGYKAGGFNADLPADADPKLNKFDVETALNYEAGIKSYFNDGSVKTSLSVFYMERDKPQFDGYTYVGVNYIYFTENFDSATNYGLEAELDWQATANWDFFGSLGLLKTDVSGQSIVEVFRVDGREQAHAPGYQFNVGAQYRDGRGWFARAEARGMDEFYFSNSHDAHSDAYTLYNARLGFEAGKWEAYLWGKNLSDEKYATRGFFFGNNPEKGYVEEPYIRLGDRRMLGATVRVKF